MATLLVHYKPTFIRRINKLDNDLQKEAIEKIVQFTEVKNHPALGVHKLHGSLAGQHAFSVNFRYRIVFQYLSKTEVVLLAIGDHDIYKIRAPIEA